jgi:hypothetical protein
MIRHVLLFKFRPSTSDEERRRAVSLPRQLGAIIPDVREWSIGEQITHSVKGYTLAQVSAFDGLDALERFRRHPCHIEVRNLFAKIADWISVDYELE